MEQKAQIELPEGRLSTLSISPDGSFMAAGGSDAELTLWDLRMDRLRMVLRQPLAACTVTDLAFAISLAENPALNPDLRGLLSLAVSLLRFRFRFDVQIEETKTIRPGEFDIIL
jgi:WD40 repeat protein